MTEKTGYIERQHRIYGHRCTRRRYIFELIKTVCYVVGGTAWFVVEVTANHTTNRLTALVFAVGLLAVANRINAMNVNGYDDEKEDEKDIPKLFRLRD